MSPYIKPGITIKECDISEKFIDLNQGIKRRGFNKILKNLECFNFNGEIYIKYFLDEGIPVVEDIYHFSFRLENIFPPKKMKIKVWKMLHGGY